MPKGTPNREIAKLLNISLKTVETHRLAVLKKLKIGTTAGLVRVSGIPCSLVEGDNDRQSSGEARREIAKPCFENTPHLTIERCKIPVLASTHRPARVQFSPPQSAPMQPSTFNVFGPASETWLT